MDRKKTIYLVSAVLCLIVLLIAMVVEPQNTEELFSFEVKTQTGAEEIHYVQTEPGIYYVFLPSYADLPQTTVRLHTSGAVEIGDLKLQDGQSCREFALDVPYLFSCEGLRWGDDNQITFVKSAGVATMHIDTQTGSMEYIHESKNNEESGWIRVYTENGQTNYDGTMEALNGRGNSTWDWYEKKPYSLKLAQEADLLDMGDAQKWILLANAADSSNLRNKIVYDFAYQAGLLSPDSRWVDLYLNGNYAGLYLLCERNEVQKNRVDIDPNVDFLVSKENNTLYSSAKDIYFTTKRNQTLRVHAPKLLEEEALQPLKERWESVETAILAEDGVDLDTGLHWKDLIDIDSWARGYLTEEVFGNHDAGWRSQFFYTNSEQSGRIYLGPVWDYDLTMGNVEIWQITNPQCMYANRLHVQPGTETPWFHTLYQREEFYCYVVNLYKKEFHPLLNRFINENVSQYVQKIGEASKMNLIRWPDDKGDIQKQEADLKEYLERRMEYLDRIWLQNEEYYVVTLDNGGVYGYFSVFPGEYVTDVPVFEDQNGMTFLGWYDSETDEPFDINKPITENIRIYAKWQKKISGKLESVFKLIPLAVFVNMFLLIFCAMYKRERRR